MAGGEKPRRHPRLGLIVRSAPWQSRSGREALELALAAVTLDFDVELFFLRRGLLQLLPDARPHEASLPPGLRAWASLPALGDVRFWAERESLRRLAATGHGCIIQPEALDAPELRQRQELCQRLLVV